ncbi:DNA polymerase IV [Aromatoleum petrolei]|uniref:DNA polymerase IV n=1 Tax=Aromatoleum petrolei TaxID=76116 RepID=A0ABX1MNG8_9RHOO|nr:DNA polymerase IV [Aromatoleum petrolei]NMF89465.1 DNA polymerase IV [Aromatoleum petrolei]QTQ36226.1 DNA polymerase IV [Aromatoleum petrolei]
MQRRIAHLDMDAFFASVELLRYPQLAGLPVVVGGRRGTLAGDRPDDFPRLRDYVGRGVATTATYPARALGVHSGIGLMKAAALAPDAILLPANFDDYIRYSRLFKAAVAEIAPLIEDRGIDEIYIDLTGVPGETVELAQRIKDAVRAATGLSCSIGVTPNKLLSKIASDLDKPDGLTVLDYADIPTRIWPLAARKINGIGPRAGEKLDAMGIHTIGDLAAAAPESLIKEFGQHYGHWLTEVAHGRDARPVVTERETKSISRETTFERDLDVRADRDALTEILVKLCERVAGDLKRKGYVGRTIGLKLRYDDFRTVTRDMTIEQATDDAATILATVRSCLKRVPLDRRLRLLGVRVGTLLPPGEAGPRPPQPGENLRLFD